MREYEEYAGNLTSLPVIQDFFAIRKLKENGLIENNAVIVPGHSGDMLAGSWIPRDITTMLPNENKYTNHIFHTHYSLQEWNNAKNNLNIAFKFKIKPKIENTYINDTKSLLNYIEYFNFNERQAKFIVNSVRAYEYLGYGWRIPLWDNELMDFFLKINLKFRNNQYLYQFYVVNEIITNYFPELINIPSTSIKNSNSSLKEDMKNAVFKFNLLKPFIWFIFYKYKKISEYSTNKYFYGIMSKENLRSFIMDMKILIHFLLVNIFNSI